MSFKKELSPNKIGTRITLSLLLCAFISLLVYLALNDIIVSRNLAILETKNIETKSEQVTNAIVAQAQTIRKLACDYAVWDETYTKVKEERIDRDWLEKNFSGWLPEHYGLDLILVADEEEKIIDSHGLSPLSARILLDKSYLSATRQGQDGKEPENYPCGLIMLNDQLYLLGASPILAHNFAGESHGIVVLCKKVTPLILGEIEKQFSSRLFIRYNDRFIGYSSNNREMAELYNTYRRQEDAGVVRYGQESIINKVDLEDISHHVVGELFIVEERDSYLTALTTIRQNGYYVFVVALFIIALLSYNMHRTITRPIAHLERQIAMMSRGGDLGHVRVGGSEEIQNLGRTFNRMADSIKRAEEEKEALRVLSALDNLTGLFNHRYLFEYLEKHYIQGNKKLAVLFCDIDHFSYINDAHGHVVGDQVIREIGLTLKKSAGDKNPVFRYGGEEFVIIISNCDEKEACTIAERIRTGVYSSSSIQKYAGYLPITISIGIAFYPKDGLYFDDVIEKADKAMYYAKQKGENLWCVYHSALEEPHKERVEQLALQDALTNSVSSLVAAIDARDNYTGKHSELVAHYALILADKIGMSEKDKYDLKVGGLLHDCGKIGIPDEILKKTGPLSEEEWHIIKNHTILGSNIIKYIIKRPEIQACIRNHHECWDGKGYPDGLKEKEIPLHARIICIADAYHAMTSARPYRIAMTKEEAISHLLAGKGTQFDPYLLEMFIEALREREGV